MMRNPGRVSNYSTSKADSDRVGTSPATLPEKPPVKPYILRLAMLSGFVIAIGLLSVWVFHNHVHAPGSMVQPGHSLDIELKGQRFVVEIADTTTLREQGLSNRQNLASDRGMLFIFQQPDKACFWMKDMRFNLDILWFDTQKNLIYQQKNLSPSTYPQTYCPPMPALYVVEVNAGTSAKLGLAPGDVLTFQKQ